MNPVARKSIWWFQKKRWLIDALLLGRGPDFAVERNPSRDLGHIPVFTFHVAVPERFEAQCAYLAENNYRAIDACELEMLMYGKLKPHPRSVALTFDDGLKQVWTVAFPILRKYGLKAIVFLVPGCISHEQDEPRRTLQDVWKGEAEESDIFGIWPGESPLVTWPEVRAMHESGHVDFQSHSMWHSLVFNSEEIVDFGRPDYDKHYFGNVHVPLYQSGGAEQTDRELRLGMPLYAAAPRFQVASRFLDDEALREHCIQFVDSNGGSDFFEREDWERELRNLVRRYQERNTPIQRYETPEERDMAVKAELRMAKNAIDSRLGGKSVEHFCFPWYRGAEFARACAWATGHKLVYTDFDPAVPGNVAGSGNRTIARIEECFLRRLPGAGRLSKFDMVREIVALRNLPGRMFPANV